MSIEPRDGAPRPEDATVVDARNGRVMPGLADMHVHFGTGGLGPTDAERLDRVLRQFVVYGVTTVLNLGATHGTSDAIHRLRAGIDAGTLIGPTIYASGGLITLPGSHPVGTIMFPPERHDLQAYDWTTRGVFIVDSPKDMRTTVDRRAVGGADAVKVVIESGPPPFGDTHPQMPPAMVTAAAEAAHARGLPLLAHASSIDELEVALDAGVDGIVHLVRHPATPDDALFARMRAAGVWYIPTMSIHVWPDVWGVPADQFTESFLREGVDPSAIASLLDSPMLPRAPAGEEDWAVRRAAVSA
jgi:imidazolonepropionase-like amidohydrolase